MPMEAAPLGVGEVVVSEVVEGSLPEGLGADPEPVLQASGQQVDTNDLPIELRRTLRRFG